MSGTYRPMYETDAACFNRDTTSQWAVAAGAAITASNFQSIAGAISWTIQIPDAVTGLAGGRVGNLVVQVNNSNPVTRAAVSGIAWTTSPLLRQPSQGQHNVVAISPSFTACWSSVGTVGGTVSITAFTLPARYVRLFGLGLTALSANNAYLWTDGMSHGN